MSADVFTGQRRLGDGDLFQRSSAWAEAGRARVRRLREQLEEQEMGECTFQPAKIATQKADSRAAAPTRAPHTTSRPPSRHRQSRCQTAAEARGRGGGGGGGGGAVEGAGVGVHVARQERGRRERSCRRLAAEAVGRRCFDPLHKATPEAGRRCQCGQHSTAPGCSSCQWRPTFLGGQPTWGSDGHRAGNGRRAVRRGLLRREHDIVAQVFAASKTRWTTQVVGHVFDTEGASTMRHVASDSRGVGGQGFCGGKPMHSSPRPPDEPATPLQGISGGMLAPANQPGAVRVTSSSRMGSAVSVGLVSHGSQDESSVSAQPWQRSKSQLPADYVSRPLSRNAVHEGAAAANPSHPMHMPLSPHHAGVESVDTYGSEDSSSPEAVDAGTASHDSGDATMQRLSHADILSDLTALRDSVRRQKNVVHTVVSVVDSGLNQRISLERRVAAIEQAVGGLEFALNRLPNEAWGPDADATRPVLVDQTVGTVDDSRTIMDASAVTWLSSPAPTTLPDPSEVSGASTPETAACRDSSDADLELGGKSPSAAVLSPMSQQASPIATVVPTPAERPRPPVAKTLRFLPVRVGVDDRFVPDEGIGRGRRPALTSPRRRGEKPMPAASPRESRRRLPLATPARKLAMTGQCTENYDLVHNTWSIKRGDTVLRYRVVARQGFVPLHLLTVSPRGRFQQSAAMNAPGTHPVTLFLSDSAHTRLDLKFLKAAVRETWVVALLDACQRSKTRHEGSRTYTSVEDFEGLDGLCELRKSKFDTLASADAPSEWEMRYVRLRAALGRLEWYVLEDVTPQPKVDLDGGANS